METNPKKTIMTRSTGLWRVYAGLLFTGVLTAVLLAATDRAAGDSSKGLPTTPVPDATAPATATAETEVDQTNQLSFSNPLELMRLGGYMMWAIAACSVLMAAYFFERLIAMRRSRIVPQHFVTRVLSQIREGTLDQQQTIALCKENGTPVALLFAAAAAKWGRPAVEVEQAIVDAGERATFGLRANLRVFSALHTLGPLLGLVGTVFGIIRAFNALATHADQSRAEMLARGISQALLTTAFGLIVAIPALVIYLWFLSKADRFTFEMDGLGQDLVGLISAEAMHARPAKPRRAPREETTPEK